MTGRIPKYKAWDKIGERICDVGYIDFANEKAQLAIIVDNTRKCYGSWECSFEDIELLEYTGLHDKNGKEIYEGDILNRTFDDSKITVIFERGAFTVKSITSVAIWGECTRRLFSISMDKFEVVGNIFENKELLQDVE